MVPGADCANMVGKEGIKIKSEAKEGGAVAIEIVVNLRGSLSSLTTVILWRSPDTLSPFLVHSTSAQNPPAMLCHLSAHSLTTDSDPHPIASRHLVAGDHRPQQAPLIGAPPRSPNAI